MAGRGKTDACRPIQKAGSTMAETWPTTYGDCEEQRRCLAISKTILHRRLPLPSVNHNDCVGDGLLCVFPLDSLKNCLYPSRFRKSV